MNPWTKIRTACADLSPNCREASRAQSEALDHPLPPFKQVGLRLHLLICKWCRRYGKQIRFMREAVHNHEAEFTKTSPQTLSTETRERIKERLRGQ
jgi:hypothetical protein